MDSELRKRIENLRRAALECEPQERETFLEKSCAGNKELRHAVQALLTESENRTNPGIEPTGPAVPEADLDTQKLKPERLQWPEGPHLGHYRVLAQLGKGAMGVVYLAHDGRLNRKIALKMLPVEFTKEQSRLRRFEREARAASALNHPNVMTVHEVGESNGIHFIATEFIEGNTLRRVMASEKIELREKLRIGSQIAAALDSTHRAKVIHRDIKPENIMVRPDGLVKVLDFGLARLTPERGTSDDQQRSSTLVETQSGMWAGTPRYMSPEQVKGQELDSRTDIFSLGVVLYEMVSGRPPFSSGKPEDLFDAICNDEPASMSGPQSEVPVELQEIIRKTLEKDPNRRIQTAGELKAQLDALGQKLEREQDENGFVRRHRVKLRIAATAFAIGGIAILWWWATHRPSVRPTPVITRVKNFGVDEAFASFSPDGRSVAYKASTDGEQKIWIRRIESDEASPITDGKSKDSTPIWSPDGERLAFVSDRAGRYGVWMMSTLGGRPELLKQIDMEKILLTSWSRKRNAIYFEASPNLFRLDLASGAVSLLTNFDAKHSARSFSLSPDESQIAFSALVGQKSRILVMTLGQNTPRQITFGGGEEDHSPNWLSDGKTIVYGSRLNNIYELFTIDVNVREPAQITFGDSNYQPLAVSSDAKILAVSEKDNANIFIWDLASQEELGLTSDFGLQLLPEVTPDGTKILYHASDSSRQGQGTVMVKEIDTKRQPVLIAPAGKDARWGRDSDTLAYIEGPTSGPQLWVARASGGPPRRLTEGPVLWSGWTRPPRYRLLWGYDWSPDGTRIVYCSEKPGQRGLRVASIDGKGDTFLVEVGGETMKIASPTWSPDGTRIAYVLEPLSYSRDGKRSIRIFENGESQTLFERDDRLRLLGWSSSGRELFVAAGAQPEFSSPQEVKLFEVVPGAKNRAEPRTIAEVYLHSVKLSSDGQRIAMTGRQDGRDNVMITQARSGPIVKVTNNTDPTIFYSGLTWSPDGKRLFYSKHTNWTVANLIENFK